MVGLLHSAQEVRAEASKAAFGQKLITNSMRGLVSEVIVASALQPEWAWCAADWAGWDFERADGVKLEVKQSAARQTWTKTGDGPGACRFDIKPRAGSYVGADWYPGVARQADIYVFAHHFEHRRSADHCDPTQWRFFVVAEHQLPPQAKTIGLSVVERLVGGCSIADLRTSVDDCCSGLPARAQA